MIYKHLQQAIAELEEFIVQNPNTREVRKGLAVNRGLSRLQV